MIKINELTIGETFVALGCNIENYDDAVCMQQIFNSLVANHFCQELKLGLHFDIDRREDGSYPATDYPYKEFFRLTYSNESGRVLIEK